MDLVNVPPAAGLREREAVLSGLRSGRYDMAGRLLCFLFPVVFGVFNRRLVFTGIASYEQVVALVAETHIIREQLSGLGIAHVLNEYHSVILQYLFLFGGYLGSQNRIADLQLFVGLFECDVPYGRINIGHTGKHGVVLALYVIDWDFATRSEYLLLLVVQSFPINVVRACL